MTRRSSDLEFPSAYHLSRQEAQVIIAAMMCQMSVRVHVMSADPALAVYERSLGRAAELAIERVQRHIPLTGVDVIVDRNPFQIIPELGVGGSSPSAYLVQVSVDPDRSDFRQILREHLPRTLAHELHHSVRWRGPGYGRSLGEALVSEGLADHFDLEVYPNKLPYHWTRALDEDGLREAWRAAQDSLWDEGYDHTLWFFNSSGNGLALHAGYSLGFELVSPVYS